MATLRQPLPLNHPPPTQTTPQPPLKKPRINAKPKLTPHHITRNNHIHTALRIGREARAAPPNPGEEHKALDNLLKRMQAWAHQVAPEYTLAEFVIAAQAIAGNRELRPMLGEFRLAELRDVNAAEGTHPENHQHRPERDPSHVDGGPDASPATAAAAAVRADTGPVEADVGPLEADVGPQDDDWDELELIPDEAVEIRPIPNHQTPAPANSGNNKHETQEKKLSPDLEAKIEQNRRAAIERRKAVIARLRADKEAEKKNIGRDPDTSKELAKTTSSDLDMGKSNDKQKTFPDVQSSPSSSESKTPLSEKPNPADDDLLSKQAKAAPEENEQNIASKETEESVSNSCEDVQTAARSKTDLPNQAPQEHGESKNAEENEPATQSDHCSSESKQKTPDATSDSQGIGKSEPSPRKGDNTDQDVVMEILAEFEGGDEM